MSISAGAILGLISLISALTSSGIEIGKSNKQGENEKKAKNYKDDVEAFNEKQQKAEAKERRRQALARAIGSDVTFSPDSAPKAPGEPDYDSMTDLNVAGGITNVVGQGAAEAAGTKWDNINQTPGDKAMGELAPGTTAAPTSTYTQTSGIQSMGDPLSATTGNRYKRYAEQNYKYS